MSIKTRLSKLEENHAAKARQKVIYDKPVFSQWLKDLIQSINDGTHVSTPWIIRPVPPCTGLSGTYLHDLLNRL